MIVVNTFKNAQKSEIDSIYTSP